MTHDDLTLFDEIERHMQHIYVLNHKLTQMVPQHRHKQGHILVVRSGVATLNVERHAFFIPYGYFVWIPARMLHRVSFEDNCIQLLNIYFPQELPQDELYKDAGIYPMNSLLYHALEYVQDSTTSYTPNDWHYDLLASMLRMLPHIVPQRRSQLWLPTTDHPTIIHITEIIRQRYMTSLTAQNVANEVGLSVRTMSRYLQNELGISFVHYLRKYRIVMAIKMMVKNEESITNIAYSVGYESLTAFSNSFQIVTGYRPSQFLK